MSFKSPRMYNKYVWALNKLAARYALNPGVIILIESGTKRMSSILPMAILCCLRLFALSASKGTPCHNSLAISRLLLLPIFGCKTISLNVRLTGSAGWGLAVVPAVAAVFSTLATLNRGGTVIPWAKDRSSIFFFFWSYLCIKMKGVSGFRTKIGYVTL